MRPGTGVMGAWHPAFALYGVSPGAYRTVQGVQSRVDTRTAPSGGKRGFAAAEPGEVAGTIHAICGGQEVMSK
jgi:hypothetical protein